MQYKAFISYNHRDEAIAKQLHHQLERFRPPHGLTLPDGRAPERLYPIFRDREEMGASPSLPETIETALMASDHLIVLCSPTSATSSWVNEEIRLFVDAKGADQVLPVIVSGNPPDCFPKALQDALVEPLAPDFREGKDGYADGMLKIIAGLWGVSLGVLKNREAARQRMRARLNATVAAVFAALIVFAGFSAWRALEQAQRAELQAQVAEARSLASIARFTFDRNAGETSVAAMIAAQSLQMKPTPEAHELLRKALKLAPLGATTAPYPWLRPNVETSRNGRVAAFMSVFSSDDPPARSTLVRLSPELKELERVSFDGLAEPVFSADGVWMAAAGHLRRLFVQNLKTGETALNQPMTSGFGATFSSDSSALFAATQLGEVLRWSPGMEQPTEFASTPGGGDRLTLPDLSVTASSDTLLRTETAQPSTIISMTDGVTRKAPFSPKYTKVGWREQTPTGAVSLPNSAHFIAYDSYNTGALLDLKTMETLWSFDDKSRSWSRERANVISSDGALYARGRGDGELIVRDMVDGGILHRSDHGGAVFAMTFLNQPTYFAAAGDDGASIWKVGADKPIAQCARGAKTLSLVLEATGSLLLGMQDGRLIRCDPRTGATQREHTFDFPVASIAVAPGHIAITLKQTRMSDNWTELSFLNRETRATRHLSLNQSFDQLKLTADGTRAATRTWPTREVAIWDTSNGALMNSISAQGNIIGLTPDGQRLLMNSLALDVYDVSSGQRIHQFGEAGGVSSLLSAPYEDTFITSGKIDGREEYWAWDVETGEQRWRVLGDVTLTADGTVYAEHVPDEDRWRVIKRTTGKEIGSVPFLDDPWGATLSPNGANIAVVRRVTDEAGDLSYETQLWDARNGKLIWKRGGRSTNSPSSRIIPLSNDRAAYFYVTRAESGAFKSEIDVFDWATGFIVFSAQWPSFGAPEFAVDHKQKNVLIAAAGTTSLHRLSDGHRLWSIQTDYSRSMAFSPNGDFIVAGRPGHDGKDGITVLDQKTGERRREWSFELTIQDIAVTSDGRLALVALDGAEWSGLRAWRINDGALAFEMETDAAPRRLIALRDPNRVLVHDYQGSVRSFDLNQRQEVQRFPMSIRAASGAINVDGARAITASGARLRYWSVATGEEIDSHLADSQVTQLGISTDGAEVSFITRRKRMARGGVDASLVKIWRPTTDEPVEILAASKPQRLDYGPADAVLAISSGANERRIFDASTLAPRFTVKPLESGAFSTYTKGLRLFTGDGAHFAVLETASYGQGNTSEQRAALRVFNVSSGAEIARFDVNPAARGLAPTQNGYFYNDVKGRSRHFEIGASALDRKLTSRPRDEVRTVHGSDLILASDYRGGDALIDIQSGDRINLTIERDNHYTLDSAVAPSGRLIALSRLRDDGNAEAVSEILIFDARTGDLIATSLPLQVRLNHIEFAEGGETIVAAEYNASALISNADDNGGLYTWRWQDGDLTPLIDDNPVSDFKISADGEWLVTAEGGKNTSSDETYGKLQARLISLADGSTRLTRPHDLYGSNLAISADGGRIGLFSSSSPIEGDLIAVSDGGGVETLLEISFTDAAIFGQPLGFINKSAKFVVGERSGARVFDLETSEAKRLRVPGRAKRYALSADGALLAIGGDAFVSIWDLATSEQITTLKVADLSSLVFAGADMRSLIAGTSNGVFRLEWDTETLISTACRVFQSDVWAAGKERIVSTDAPEACVR